MKMNRQPDRPARIEMLPLIDIVFLLLVFFIYAMLSMTVQRGLHLDLPDSSQTQVTPDKAVAISVCRGEAGLEVYVDKEALPLDLLAKRLESLVCSETEKKPQVALFAEKSISYQELFLVLDRIRLSGVEDISLQAEAGQ
jgi:biopolymer transport protein ExbD